MVCGGGGGGRRVEGPRGGGGGGHGQPLVLPSSNLQPPFFRGSKMTAPSNYLYMISSETPMLVPVFKKAVPPHTFWVVVVVVGSGGGNSRDLLLGRQCTQH